MCWRQGGECLLQFVLREFEFGHRVGAQGIETPGVLDDRGIATCLHFGKNVGDSLFNAGVLCSFEGQQGIESLIEVGIGAGKAFDCDHGSTTPAMASRIGASHSRFSLSAA
ncbi:MAG: hypothetical protein CAPSK01_002263 [Candidatus Accumulibacter vicinus]|uniref:Uncharacterized protein n=1 Tax=Candidatus Accumulibacter vicinus TaxID=2954382 RepID=A0A084Y115_9PROT|nr:MAG: hypothetical protein CAPSK01_002263 [Candidatus Accumulibacter vicinus]